MDLDALERPDSEPEPEPDPGTLAVGRLTVEVDLVLSPASLARLEEQLSETITRAVVAGFGRAGQ